MKLGSFFALLWSPSTLAFSESQNVALNMRGEMSLFWLDFFKSPLLGPSKGQTTTDDQATPSHQSDFLGLKKSRFQFDFANGKKSNLILVLRPDSLAAHEPNTQVRELDTRLGDVLAPSPTISFLDSYEIHITPFKALSASIGVFDTLNKSVEAYSSDLEFGLELHSVSKTSGIWLNWRPDTVRGTIADLDFIIFRGPDERGEFKTIDSNNSANNKYITSGDRKNGGAIAVSYYPHGNFSLYGNLTYFESSLIQGSSSSRTQVQLGNQWLFNNLSHHILLAFDGRYALDSITPSRISNQEVDEVQRIHYSLKISGTVRVVPELYTLINLQYGAATLANGEANSIKESKLRRGYQYELGLRSGESRGVYTQLTLAEEVRTASDKNDPAFETRNGSLRNSAQRIAISLNYIFDSRF